MYVQPYKKKKIQKKSSINSVVRTMYTKKLYVASSRIAGYVIRTPARTHIKK